MNVSQKPILTVFYPCIFLIKYAPVPHPDPDGWNPQKRYDL